MADDTPPLPAGYTLSESTPPLPPGYKLEGDSTPKPDSFLGGMGRRAIDAVKGLAALNPAPVTSQETIAQHPMQAAMDAVPGLSTVAKFVQGQYQGSKEALHQAVDQLHEAWTSKGDVATKALQYARAGTTGLSALDPFATGSVTNVNKLSDQGRMGEAAGQGTADALMLGAPKIAQGAGAVVSKVAPQIAEKMYASALKPSTTIPAAQRSTILQTGLNNSIPISEAGAAKLSGLIDDLNNQIKGKIQDGANKGATIDPRAVAARADQVKGKFTNQVNPDSDLAAIDASKQEFLNNQHVPPAGAAGPVPGIPVDVAQAMKQGTYQQLKARAYGQLGSGTIEAQKALARGIKEELQTQFPEIGGLNAQEAKFMGLDSVLEKAINRIGNHNLVGIGTPIVGGAAGAAAGGPAAIASMVLKATLDDPIVKSRLAIILNKAGRGKIPMSDAMGRVANFSAALGQGQANSQPQQ